MFMFEVLKWSLEFKKRAKAEGNEAVYEKPALFFLEEVSQRKLEKARTCEAI